MPRRKRYYIYCKKGLHLLSRWGGLRISKRKVFNRTRFITRFCLLCRRDYQRNYMRQRKKEPVKKSPSKVPDPVCGPFHANCYCD